jgi:hypothetical protein
MAHHRKWRFRTQSHQAVFIDPRQSHYVAGRHIESVRAFATGAQTAQIHERSRGTCPPDRFLMLVFPFAVGAVGAIELAASAFADGPFDARGCFNQPERKVESTVERHVIALARWSLKNATQRLRASRSLLVPSSV